MNVFDCSSVSLNFKVSFFLLQDFINSILVPHDERPQVNDVRRHDWLTDFTK